MGGSVSRIIAGVLILVILACIFRIAKKIERKR